MFNENMFNEQVFNGNNLPALDNEELNFYIKYNGFNLSDNSITFSTPQYFNPKGISYNESSFGNMGQIYNIIEEKKTITITGTIKVSTRSELINKTNELKYKLRENNKNLIIKDSDKKYFIKCIANKIEFSENYYNINWMNFTITFETYEYLQKYAPISAIINITSNSYSFNLSNDGTTESKVYFLFKYNGATTVNQLNLTIGSQVITINSTISTGDIIIIDGYEINITQNGSLVDFDGEIPYLKVGNNLINISHNGTIDLELFYKTNYSYK